MSWRSPDDSDTPRSCTQRVDPFGQVRDQLVETDAVHGLHHLVVGRVGPRERDVVAHGAREEERLLRHDAELAAERLDGHVAQVEAVDAHAPRGRVVEARDELGDGRLPRAGRPDERHRLAGVDVEVDVAQHRDRGVVPERHADELHVALDQRERRGVLRLLDRRVRREELVELDDRRLALLVEVVLLDELLDRLEERVEVEDERGELADLQRAVAAPSCRR